MLKTHAEAFLAGTFGELLELQGKVWRWLALSNANDLSAWGRILAGKVQ
jgi:hypothetical protein